MRIQCFNKFYNSRFYVCPSLPGAKNTQGNFNHMNKGYYALGRLMTKNYANGLDDQAHQFENSKVVSIVEMLERNGCRRNCYNYKVDFKKRGKGKYWIRPWPFHILYRNN